MYDWIVLIRRGLHKWNQIRTGHWNIGPPTKVNEQPRKKKSVPQRAGAVNRCFQNKQRCVQALLGPTRAPTRRVKQSRALHVHNGDTVSKSRGGEPRTNSTQEFHKQPVIRHSAGRVWLGHPAHTLGQGWGRGHPTSACWDKNDTWGEGERGWGQRERESDAERGRQEERQRERKKFKGVSVFFSL